MALYYPAIMTLADSPRFARISPTGIFDDFYMPAVYPVFLHLLRGVSDQVWFTIAIQHLGGLAVGLLVFLAVRRLGLRPGPRLIPTAVVLLSGDHIYLEHVFMADWLLIALATAGLAAGVRGPGAGDRPALAGGGRGAAGARRAHPQRRHRAARSCSRSQRCSRPPTGVRRWIARRCGAGRGRGVLPSYMGAFLISDGRYAGLTDFAGWNLYSRVAPFADCSKFDPPGGDRVLCEDVPPEQRPGPFGYVWDANSVSRRNFAPMGPETGGPLQDFARQAIIHQPLDYLGAVGPGLRPLLRPRDQQRQAVVGAVPGPDLVRLPRPADRAECGRVRWTRSTTALQLCTSAATACWPPTRRSSGSTSCCWSAACC